MRFGHGITVTVHRTTTDRYGDTTDTSSHSLDGCGLASRSSAENTDRRDTVSTVRVLLAPPGADIVATDVVELPDGTRWDVTGDPVAPSSPFTGWTPGVAATLTRVTG